MKQLINPQTGEFILDRSFVISRTTSVHDLVNHFGEERLSVRDFKNGHSQYMIYNLELDDLYFILTVYFLNEQITKVDFVVQDKPYDDNAGWDNFDAKEEKKKGAFMERWMAKQRNDDARRYDWGTLGVSYDFHHLSYSCFISYHTEAGTA